MPWEVARDLRTMLRVWMLTLCFAFSACKMSAQEVAPNESAKPPPWWNIHAQNTDVVQYHPGFPADYSGPNSLSDASEVRETVSFDVLMGARLWQGAEVHADGMAWQGFGFSKTLGAAGFPNGEAFRTGAAEPDVTFSRAFVRQTIGLGGEQETVDDGPLQLAGKRDISRLTITAGKMSAKDIFDNNAYANDSRTQFMNWSLMANGAWDYPADSLGFETGVVIEWNEPQWTWRYGWFQVPRLSNHMGTDHNVLDAWSMVTEFERRYEIEKHHGAVRLLLYLEHSHMGRFDDALADPARPPDLIATRAYRSKYGVGLNAEQEITQNIGVFARLGWNNGQTEPWAFTDVDHTASLGVSIKGTSWNRPHDTVGVAGVLNGITRIHQRYLAEGGTGILVGDGDLSYGMEKIVEMYYDFAIMKSLHATLDFQHIWDPAFNRDRGPVAVLGARLHWEF